MDMRSIAADANDARLVWRLVSPASRVVNCRLRRVGEGFELRVGADEDEVMVWRGEGLASLHARAAEWRTSLEGRGYRPGGRVERASARPCERRAALRGLIACADDLARHDRMAALALRDHATAALVAVGLHDETLVREATSLAWAVVRSVDDAAPDARALLESCEALLSRAAASAFT